MAVSSPYAQKESTSNAHMLVESLSILSKNTFCDSVFALNLFLVCSWILKIFVLLKGVHLI